MCWREEKTVKKTDEKKCTIEKKFRIVFKIEVQIIVQNCNKEIAYMEQKCVCV
jgi:hypothetical protein